ncbi:MAG: hypothetical protein AB7Q00_04260 [Phycisphaerales bacterium]|nr:MAG: hypothetical protein IPK69_08875 [Phycisphaerales bacterium]
MCHVRDRSGQGAQRLGLSVQPGIDRRHHTCGLNEPTRPGLAGEFAVFGLVSIADQSRISDGVVRTDANLNLNGMACRLGPIPG